MLAKLLSRHGKGSRKPRILKNKGGSYNRWNHHNVSHDAAEGPDCEAQVVGRLVEYSGVHNARNDLCGLMGSGSNSDDHDDHNEYTARNMNKPKHAKVKRYILGAETTSELTDRAVEAIQEDWVYAYGELPGNVYRMAAFGKLFYFDPNTTCLFDISRMAGCIGIWVIQVFGAPFLFLAYTFGWSVSDDKIIYWHRGFGDFSDWQDIGITKLMTMVSIAVFCLNGVFVVLDERKSWKKLDEVFNYLNRGTERYLFGEFYLVLDAFTNCWVITWCCLSSIVVMGPADNPKDVLFDSLGLLFLYNLDDIGGDLGFLNADDWPGSRLNWIYEEMAKHNWSNEHEDDEDPEGFAVATAKASILGVYWLTAAFLSACVFLLPLITGFTSYSKATSVVLPSSTPSPLNQLL